MTKKQKKNIARILVGAASYLLILLLPTETLFKGSIQWFIPVLLFLIPYLIIGGDVLLKAARNILHGQAFDENFLMSLATIGAFFIGEYPEAVAVMLFYQVGELFQDYAVNRSRKSISDLMDIRPDYANIERDGQLISVDPDEVSKGDIIIVKAGERIPLDGTVILGNSTIDTSPLTGESIPRDVMKGSDVISGCINKNGLLKISVTKKFEESTVSKILELVENASNRKAKAEHFITRFARYYTPVVVLAALALAIIPPMAFGLPFSEWIQRALIFLVISCPCALVISIPLSFFGGIGGAGKCGILVKGSNYLEALSRTETVVFDKTGTLTKGTFCVAEIKPEGVPDERLLELAALAESYSDHPISLSLKEAYKKNIDNSRIASAQEIAGHGVIAYVDGKKIHAGNAKLLQSYNIPFEKSDKPGTMVYVALDEVFIGSILISDEVKEDAALAVSALKKAGVKKTVMLTGDTKVVGKGVARELHLDEVYTELLPADKVEKVETLLSAKTGRGQLAFVGDGINDAPVLSRSDIGIAMGGLGSDAAIEAADVVLMDDQPSKIAIGIRIARKTLGIVKQNIIFALGVKFLVLVLGAFGMANMWEAVFADVGVSIIAILNASRALSTKEFVEEHVAYSSPRKKSPLSKPVEELR